MVCILMPVMGIVMKSSVTRMETLLTHLARVLTARSSWCLLWKSNPSHFAPKVRKSASISSLTEDGHRVNKTLLLGWRFKILFPNYGDSWGPGAGRVRCRHRFEQVGVFGQWWNLAWAAHAACLLSVSREPNKITPFTKPGDYAMCCKVQDYEKELESMIKKIKQLATMGCWKIVKVTSLPSGAKISIADGSTN